MKVLHINTSDIHGGAAIAANKIHRALMNIGADSTLFVQKASGNIPNTRESDGSRSWIKRQFLPYLDVLPSKFYPLKQPLLFSTNWYPSRKIVDEINSLKPDIVHLHWIARGFIRIEDIARIEAPIVWTLHDNWAFTGGCHILGSCTNYQKECGKCFRLGSRKKLDLSYCNFRRKQRTFENKTGIAFIAPSEWMAQAAKRSSIAGDSSVRTIPNPIDISTFRQLQTNVGISNGMRIILFGASTFDSNKGADLFFAALKLLSSHPVTLKVIVFGGEKKPLYEVAGIRIEEIGRISDPNVLNAQYNEADVTVVPSRQESFGQIAAESLSAGTPVVAFNYSGLTDIVSHGENGYLAKPYDVDDLAAGIDWVLTHPQPKRLSESGRNKIASDFSYDRVASMYLDVYKKLL